MRRESESRRRIARRKRAKSVCGSKSSKSSWNTPSKAMSDRLDRLDRLDRPVEALATWWKR